MRKLLFAITLSIFTLNSYAATCYVNYAKITGVYQFDDGHILVYFDKNSNCNCSVKNRMGFHKNNKERFLESMVLSAFMGNKTIYARATDSCSIHTNTTELKALFIRR